MGHDVLRAATILLISLANPASAVVRMPRFFTDGMVIQSNFQCGVRKVLNKSQITNIKKPPCQ